MSRMLLCTLCSIPLIACGASETRTEPVTVQQASDAPPTVDVSWLGGRGLVEFMVRPHRWPEVRDAVRTLIGQARLPNDLERVLSAPTLDEALSAVFRGGRIANDLPGLDPERPVLARLFEPAAPITFTQIMAVARGEAEAPLLHHWVFLPASDSNALATTLTERLSERCEPEGAHLRCHEHTVAALPVDDWVVVAIDTDTPPQPGNRDDIAWALGHPAAAHVRFSVMQEIGPYLGATMVARALGSVAPEYRDDMMSVGTSELLGAHVHLQPWMEELDDVVIAITTEPLGLVGTARMTPRGAAVPLRRGTATQPTSAPLVIRTGFDLDAAREGSPAFETIDLYSEPTDRIHALQSCGAFCFQHSFSMPFAMAGLIRRTELLSTEEIAYVVDDSLGEQELVMQAQIDQLPRPIGELGQIVPRAELRARRGDSHWVAALGFPETPSIDGLAPPNQGVSSRTAANPEETRCVVQMTLEAIAGLKSIGHVEPAQRPQILTSLTTLRDTLGSRCGSGEQATSAREAVRAALSVIP